MSSMNLFCKSSNNWPIIHNIIMLFPGTSPYGVGLHDDERQLSSINKESGRKSSTRNSPFEKFRQMEQSQETSTTSERQRLVKCFVSYWTSY